MVEEGLRKRRRRRRRRGPGVSGGAAAAPSSETSAAPGAPDWQWLTFPVFFAFVVGMLVMGIAAPIPGISAVFFFASLGGVAFGLAHVLTRTIAARRRR